MVLAGRALGGSEALSCIALADAGRFGGFAMPGAAPERTGTGNAALWVWYRRDAADGFAACFTSGRCSAGPEGSPASPGGCWRTRPRKPLIIL
ncbi:hypothetical protein [Paralimibaculum aggregatum]|uniref:hypothetical protein n=1 Tax=Paralimibaculum aggregatum TaxID=3036245 RepID=UPI0025549FC7|nr:hypothetical protein [Limibaculum sp. NKW23]